MYVITSRVKTNGSYTKCASTNKDFKNYSNKIEDDNFDNINDAINYITKNGDKSKIYYINSLYNESLDCHNKNNDMLDAGNDWFVRQRYSYIDKKWCRLCLTKPKPYNSVHK